MSTLGIIHHVNVTVKNCAREDQPCLLHAPVRANVRKSFEDSCCLNLSLNIQLPYNSSVAGNLTSFNPNIQMSGPAQNIGHTLTGGIQDVAAFLPLLGTDQCEKHVGSALDGGYLYAAAAPLSIFGCLGIVKMGISILISSISIPKVSISYRKFSINFSQDLLLGARTLDNAGFQLAGTVAPLIAMDGKHYKAETKLLQILEEKHIDRVENLTIDWKARKWNVMLILFSVIAACFSAAPYIALLLVKPQASVVRVPWIFPLLRTVGSCVATVCCQFIIQSRVISLMKNRVIFMIMNRVLVDDLPKHDILKRDLWFKQYVGWDTDLPAEQCLWSLKQFLSPSFTQTSHGPNVPKNHSSIKMSSVSHGSNESENHSSIEMSSVSHGSNESENHSSIEMSSVSHGSNKPEIHSSIDMSTFSFSDRDQIINQLRELHKKHLSTPAHDRSVALFSWIILCLSLPATAVGYVGCFTLVSNSQGNGPFIWLGLEVALSICRILVWAWNPNFDEEMDITVKLELTEDRPFVTTEKSVKIIKSTGNNTLALVPEARFLEMITPYTGPLERFGSSESLALYFTLCANRTAEPRLLYMTAFDINKRIAVTLVDEKEGLKYIDATVTCNRISSEMEAILQSAINREHPWRTNSAILFDMLAEYYKSLLHGLIRTNSQPGLIAWKWNLYPKLIKSDNPTRDNELVKLPPPSAHDQLYLRQGHEHDLKAKLVSLWGEWIISVMHWIRRDAPMDCHHTLADVTSENAQWELTELDFLVAWEWTRRELFLIQSSIKLESILRRRMEDCCAIVAKERANSQLVEWMRSEFVIRQRQRLEKEKDEAKKRMEEAMENTKAYAERDGQRLSDWESKFFDSWQSGLEFIGQQWSASIWGGKSALQNTVSDLHRRVKDHTYWHTYRMKGIIEDRMRERFNWQPQRENEQNAMDATIQRISNADSDHLDDAYQYPKAGSDVICRFVLFHLYQWVDSDRWKFCSAIVYDVSQCKEDDIATVVRGVVEKSTTSSVINVPQDLVHSIPPNDHLLFLSSSNGEELLDFIRQNRARWWDLQTHNSSTFYFSPEYVDHEGRGVWSKEGTIAHIFIFLRTQSRLRLRLLHNQGSDMKFISIQENSKELRRIHGNELSNSLQLQEYELQEFEEGKHELELVVGKVSGGAYMLRDILIEFIDDEPKDSISSPEREDDTSEHKHVDHIASGTL